MVSAPSTTELFLAGFRGYLSSFQNLSAKCNQEELSGRSPAICGGHYNPGADTIVFLVWKCLNKNHRFPLDRIKDEGDDVAFTKFFSKGSKLTCTSRIRDGTSAGRLSADSEVSK